MSPRRPRLPAAVRKAGGRPLAALRRSRQEPLLSVVMPVYDVAEYLPAALDSVLSQTLQELEVVAVDDGSTDGCLEILRDYARRDFRVRVLTQANAGQGVARNAGVDVARGEFLTFMDSDDTLPPDAYETMVRGLRATGSDFSVGNLRRLRHGELHRMIWSRTVHRQDRLGVTIEDFPNAMQDIIACNRVFRTAFWRERVGGFRGGIAYEDHVPMLAAYVRARRFDVLQKVTYHWRIREDRTSTGQQKARLGNLRDRVEVKQEAHDLLRAEASEAVHAAWVGRALEVDFPPFLPFALTGDDDYRALLAQTYRTFLDRVTPAALDQVRVAMRVRAHLAAQERWEDLFEADDWLREVQNLPPTRVVDGRLEADFPAPCTWADALPADQRWTSSLECHFEGSVEHLEWFPTELRITGWGWLRGLHSHRPFVRAWLVAGDERVPLAVERVHLPEADDWSPLSFASPADGGFVLTVDPSVLAPGDWAVEVEVAQDGLVTTGGLHGRVARSAAVRASAGVVGGLLVETRWSSADGLTLQVSPGRAVDRRGEEVEVVSAELEGSLLTVTVDRPVADAWLVGDAVTIGLTSPGAAGSTRLSFPLDAASVGALTLTAPDGAYRLRVEPSGGRAHLAVAGAAYAGRAPHHLLGDRHAVLAGQRPDGRAVLVLSAPLAADELGPRHQRRLQDTVPVPAPGAPLLLGPGPDQDALAAASPVPFRREDSLVRGSREWYSVLGAAPAVVLGEELGPWATTRPGQRRLRTVPHPYGPTGVSAWRRQGLIEHLVNREVTHAHRQWDTLLAPHDEAVPWLREQWRWEGPLLVAGRPATDPLVTGDAAAARARLVERLGLRPDVTLVLHTPAPRDELDLARGDDAPLDLGRLGDALGPAYVLLERRDPADRRPPRRAGQGGLVLDVSAHPDPTELLLGADVAVLDYSPLRFDRALTGRPMLFHVPDLEAWHEHRPTAYPWAETAPAPCLRTFDDLVDHLRSPVAPDAGALATFNARFNALSDGHVSERVLAALLGDG